MCPWAGAHRRDLCGPVDTAHKGCSLAALPERAGTPNTTGPPDTPTRGATGETAPLKDIRWEPVPPTDADEKTMPTPTLNTDEVIWAIPGAAPEPAPSWRDDSGVVAYDDDDDDDFDDLDYDDDDEEDEDYDADFLDDEEDEEVAEEDDDADEDDEDL